ncbi:hypothetical protein B0A52_06598 [Exophiala mesophila]|uniref:Pentacotripeptide-repeat region of PRORP domain-containing protein n=1 Tax=Exophiala mesophila TaxID=212818 RepID=A0A438N1K3_EXOME|nr:hypothetical protein B0A52_06598 [Exophiala mesophila]
MRHAATLTPLLDFLVPALPTHSNVSRCLALNSRSPTDRFQAETLFYDALSRTTSCQRISQRTAKRPSTRRKTSRSSPAPATTPGTPCISSTKYTTQLFTFFHRDLQIRRKSTHASSAHRTDNGITASPSRSAKAETKANPWDFFEPNTLDFAQKSRLPLAFFHDVDNLRNLTSGGGSSNTAPATQETATPPNEEDLKGQMNLLASIRNLEEKLAKARRDLKRSIATKKTLKNPSSSSNPERKQITLSKDDYKNLVDLYFYSHQQRFDPESPDESPTPTFIEDYTFKLSEDFAPPQAYKKFYDGEYRENPLKQIEKNLVSRQLKEIAVFQAFIDLLADDHSSNSALFKAYQQLPSPGVSFLPTGTVRLFLQRMSTPWSRSETSMVRYLSLLDDMQEARLPITRAEWASAIYLAGRSFGRVTEADMMRGFEVWRQMEQEAGVQSTHVTFNILFDLAVRSNKYSIAQKILKEMHTRGLRLNRLGRVSVIYYHGLRRDGDAVRKAYREFVDAGEIVDTLVLNCVIASLINAGESSAAEQIYERMKSLHSRLHVSTTEDGQPVYFKRYPGSDEVTIDRELASNSLGRILVNAAHLEAVLPDHHKELQDMMPLVPDHKTFRAMISHHANESGNLDRIVVLMKEMTEIFGLPLQSINYLLLFKGFALHGGTTYPHATWNIKRLKLIWEACLAAIMERNAYKRSPHTLSSKQLPTVKEAELMPYKTDSKKDQNQTGADLSRKTFKRLSTWNDFVLDLALFPRERRKHIERIHSELFDDPSTSRERMASLAEEQQTYYPLGERQFDIEEGEYVLPPPSITIDPSRSREDQQYDTGKTDDTTDAIDNQSFTSPFFPSTNPEADTGEKQQRDPSRDARLETEGDEIDETDTVDSDDQSREVSWNPHQVRATRSLVCWIIRAFARCTGSRTEVEAVYNEIRRVWRPHDEAEREAVLRVLQRSLYNCDLYGPPI